MIFNALLIAWNYVIDTDGLLENILGGLCR